MDKAHFDCSVDSVNAPTFHFPHVPSWCHQSWLLAETVVDRKKGHPTSPGWIPRWRWCIATPKKQAKSSPGNGEQKKKEKHKTLIYLYMQCMMNGHKREYDSLSSVNGVKIRFDGDYILERLCRVVFHIASITHSFHSNLPLSGPRCVLKESCLWHLGRIRITFAATWSVTRCISHVLVYFQSITPIKPQLLIKTEQILPGCFT